METCSNTNNILTINNLTVSFGSNAVLHGMQFTLSKGESLGIVGESGSGKSITALALMGLLPPGASIVSGSAFLSLPNGNNINLFDIKPNEHQKVRGKHLAMIFQEPMTSLNPSMRCGQQIDEALILHNSISKKSAKEKCLSLLAEMQLPDPKKAYSSYPHELSGGQKQRVMIAMALAGNPSILIADEPTTALDVTVQREILILLKRIISERSMSLIFISHDLGVIANITENLLVLKNGIVVEQGKTHRLLTNPHHAYTKGLIACKPPLSYRPVKLPTVQDYLKDDNSSSEPPYDITVENQKIFAQKPILTVNNLVVDFILKRNFFGKPQIIYRAVNHISFDLYEGETLGLVGESGCGKTTLGRAIIGLTPFKNGRISYKGKDIAHFSKSDLRQFRQDVQLVFQDPFSSLNPRLTIGETLIEPITFYNLAKGKKSLKDYVISLLEKVSLPPESFYRYPHEFSGGQRQRVAIARALAVNPKVIICDEMVSALDVSVQAQILNLLNQLKRQFGLTYIFISHDLSVVKYMSNRIMVMQQGQIMELGFSDDVYNKPSTKYTQSLIDAIPGMF